MSEPFVKDQAHRERIEKGEAILPSYPGTDGLRAALESIAGWRKVNIAGEYEHGLRDIIRSMTDCAQAALDAGAPAQQAAKPERRAPVQGYSGGIPWSMHLRAYDAYCKKYSPQQALIEGGCRGGFGVGELDDFIPGWREELSEIAALKSEIARLSAALSSTDRLCAKCGCKTKSEEALVGNEIWCHPCADNCACVGAVIGSHDSSCPYAVLSTLRQCPICARRVASPCETLAIATSCPLSSTKSGGAA